MRIPGVRRAFRLPSSPDRIAHELDEEVRFHVEQRATALIAQGWPRDRAYDEAVRKFGDVDDLKDYCISIEVAHMQRVRNKERLSSIGQDVRYALRQFRKAPGFAFVATLTLALGIGATTAIFSVVSGVLLHPLPFPNADRLAQLWGVDDKGRQLSYADPTFDEVSARNRSFASMAEFSGQFGLSYVIDGSAVPVNAAFVSRDFFATLGVRPAAGRFFVPEERQFGAPPSIVISYALWERQFAKSPRALGSVLQGTSQTMRIVGVLPTGLAFPEHTDIFLPREIYEKNTSYTAHNWRVLARLKPGVTLAQARQDVSGILRGIHRDLGKLTWTVDGQVVPLREQIVGKVSAMLYLVLGAAAVLLMIACANVVNLLVARMAVRESEIAVRIALGAGRGRLMQQLFVESLLLAAAACVFGLALTYAGVRALLALEPPNIPRVSEIGVDWRVLMFAIGVSVLTAVTLGLIAAVRGTSGDVRAALAQSQRTQAGGASYRIRGSLVVTQLAMTVVLLVGAGLLARSFVRILMVNPGFRERGVVVAHVSLPDTKTPDDLARQVAYLDEAIARLRAIPDVTAVGGVNHIPLNGGGPDGRFVILPGVDVKFQASDYERLSQDPDHTGDAEYRVASTDYFRAMNIPLLSGRMFDGRDRAGAPQVAVISEQLVKDRWPNESPIGKVIEFGNMDGDLTPITIVGVVGDVREYGLTAKPQPTFYVSYQQRGRSAGEFDLAIATPSEAATLTSARDVLRQLRRDVPVRISTIEEGVSKSVAQQRFMLLLVGVFGGVALILATLGVYSVIAYLVAQRSREISIRVALGAGAKDIVGLVLAQGISLALTGMIVGGGAAIFATRVLKNLLYEITTTDPVAFAAVLILLCVVAIAASYLPARRVARLEPMDVLRAG